MPTTQDIQAGFAEVDFTPAPGLPLLGQMHQRIAIGARDPLLCCGVALRQGETTIVLVAADIGMLALPEVCAIQKQWHERTGLDGSTLLIHATHTHDAPAAFSELMEVADPQFLNDLQNAILQCALDALEKLEPVEIFASCGHLENMGWNRRAMLEDGSSAMYANSLTPGFIGMEGPRDPNLPVLFCRNASGEITGILLSFATHPNAIESATVYSADIPGAARRSLRKLFGQNIGVVYLTGCAGNTAPSVLDPYDESHPWRGDAGLERSGLYLAGEAAKVIASTLSPMQSPELKMQSDVLQIPIRQWPKPDEPTHPRSPDNPYYQRAEKEWPEYSRRNALTETRVHVLRIGDAVICTNPAELFVEFGLEVRENSPARVTFTSQLTDGYIGYIPTEKAFSRGGYETWCAPSSKLDVSAGSRIATATSQILREFFND
jgi:hypothetical protein